MRTFLSLAWRNIWRNRRRTLITASAIAFSIAITLYVIAMMDGSHDAMLRQAVRIFSGTIQVHRAGYHEDPVVERSFPLDRRSLGVIEGIPGVTGCSPRLQSQALAANERNSTGAFLVGVEPSRERSVTVIAERIVEGAFLPAGKGRACAIGEKMALNLGSPVGSTIVLLTQGFDGSVGALRFEVRGVFRTGTDEMDGSLVLVSLADAQELLHAPGRVNSVALMTPSAERVPAVVEALRSALPDGFEVLGWKELMPDLVQFVILDSVGGYIFLALLMLVVIFGVLSTIFMSVLERTRELGMMLALGTRPGQVALVVLLEALLLTAAGVVVGLLFGVGFSAYGVSHPIDLPAATDSISSHWGMENKIFFAIYPLRMAIAVAAVILLSLLFSWYPAWKASRLAPDRALRAANQ